MYSDVHKQRTKADDFFDGTPQYANQTDVLLHQIWRLTL